MQFGNPLSCYKYSLIKAARLSSMLYTMDPASLLHKCYAFENQSNFWSFSTLRNFWSFSTLITSSIIIDLNTIWHAIAFVITVIALTAINVFRKKTKQRLLTESRNILTLSYNRLQRYVWSKLHKYPSRHDRQVYSQCQRQSSSRIHVISYVPKFDFSPTKMHYETDLYVLVL